MNNWWGKITEQEKLQLLYWLLSRELLDIPDVGNEVVNTATLDTMMQMVNWDYAFYDPLNDFIETELPGEKELFSQVENIVFNLQQLEANEGLQLAASQLLQIKYWYGKHMEIQISGLHEETLKYAENEIPLQFIKKLYHRLKTNAMKEEQLVYLSNEIKYGGFDEKLIPALQEKLAGNEDKFQLVQETQIGKDTVQATLNFNRSEKNGYYYFNDFTLKITPGDTESAEIVQHVPRNKDARFTLKQGYNLAMGRAVGIIHIDDHKQVTETWALPDKKFTHNDGSPQIKSLPASYKYEIEKVLQAYNILELKDEDERTALLHSIRRGNLTPATAERSDGIHVKVLITANPLARAIHIHDAANGQKLNRNDFLVPGQSQERSHSRAQSETQGPGEMEAPDLPDLAKKRRHTR